MQKSNMRKFKKIKLMLVVFIIIMVMNFLTGCALLVVGGLAGTTGYLAAKQGYGVQSPVTKK
ncbi:MAG: hypothetical protein EVJ46_00570 [Candidatus Acididesulfobacter guangdongensis]|uniref:Uncharacterized protein n=1 Tax=Acididesulfobacter guangdongensis TaxID=2597225 RepID=A0A519BHN1_ACIG2|nr:MAG: hypothetical protein EVJ46_00570 [Candidatus Acididesulfobacter guangdongensis]